MRISAQPGFKSSAGRSECRRDASAFTMIEIAISLAIIGFALVAIVGVLPAGLNVQKENREETILNQDGPFLLEAIRSGAAHLPERILRKHGGAGRRCICDCGSNRVRLGKTGRVEASR